MLFFLISSLPFILLLSKSLPPKPLPSWVDELRLVLILLCQEFLCCFVDWLRNCRLVSTQVFRVPSTMASREKSVPVMENVGETEEMTVLDLPELALECILEKLSPAGLCNMAGVCKSLKDRCTSDHLWERHLREKWGKILGRAACREWLVFVASQRQSSSSAIGSAKPKGWLGSLACAWPLSWIRSRLDSGSKARIAQPLDSIMSWYLALESGKFWFPGQVYNRENGHVGFMLSCYDAELSYDCHTDTFHARYLPHGRRATNIEDGVQWNRLRAPPIDTPAHELHISDCLNELCPGDHIEIQWRRNKEFPYGWWYGVVGHLESCNGNQCYCRCHSSDTIILEFNHYTLGSRWRRTVINRKDHREEGNETGGFYGGIRKLHSKDEISTWRRLWPSDVLE